MRIRLALAALVAGLVIGCAAYRDSFRAPPPIDYERPAPKQAIITGRSLRPYEALIFQADAPEGLPICFARTHDPDTAACLTLGVIRQIALGRDRQAGP